MGRRPKEEVEARWNFICNKNHQKQIWTGRSSGEARRTLNYSYLVTSAAFVLGAGAFEL